MIDTTRISKSVVAELTEYFDWGDDLREAGFHRQAACYELFLDGRIPYNVMVRHFERQRLAGFADKLKSLPRKLRNIVQQQTAKWQQGISNAVKGSAQELAALQGIGDEAAAKTKKTLIQKSVEAVAKRVMSDYEESLAAIKDDPKAVEEFVEKLSQGAVKSMAATVGGAAAAFLFAGPAAVGVFLFRKALFNAAKSAIKAGDAKLERVLGEGYTEKKQKVKDVAKQKITSIIRGAFKSLGKAGQGIGFGVGAMAIMLKAGKNTKEALSITSGYLEKKLGKTGAAAVTGVLKGLIIGGVIRGGAAIVGAVAEWFSDDEVAGSMVAISGTETSEELRELDALHMEQTEARELKEMAEIDALEALNSQQEAARELNAQIKSAADAVKTDKIFLEYIQAVGQESGAEQYVLKGTIGLQADSDEDAIAKAVAKIKGVLLEHGSELDIDQADLDDMLNIDAKPRGDGSYAVSVNLFTEKGEMVERVMNDWLGGVESEATAIDSFDLLELDQETAS